LAEFLPVEGADAARAQGFVSRDMRHHRTGPTDRANEQELTAAQLALYRWLARLPEGWTELCAPDELRAEPQSALVTAAEYYDAVADRFGMETAYDGERHKALHFEQATELKDQHIANLEGAVGGLRHQVEAQATRIAALEAQVEDLEGANEDLRHELRTLREDGRAAAGNLLAVAKRGLSGRPAE
jgi:chromosome segregation ATPase